MDLEFEGCFLNVPETYRILLPQGPHIWTTPFCYISSLQQLLGQKCSG